MKDSIKGFLPKTLMTAYEAECRKETHINRALRLFGEKTTYVEIGVRDGLCIHQINAHRKAAIDPAPVRPEFIKSDGTELFPIPSDEFFASHSENWLQEDRINVALVDGLHEFEQALRDVLHLEPLMAENGIIFVHDCNPITRRHEQDRNFTWNGDVWKVPYYLRKYRPELNYFTLDCDWGLGVISRVSSLAPDPDPDRIREVKGLDYSVLDDQRKAILRLRNPLYSRFFFSRVRS